MPSLKSFSVEQMMASCISTRIMAQIDHLCEASRSMRMKMQVKLHPIDLAMFTSRMSPSSTKHMLIASVDPWTRLTISKLYPTTSQASTRFTSKRCPLMKGLLRNHRRRKESKLIISLIRWFICAIDSPTWSVSNLLTSLESRNVEGL